MPTMPTDDTRDPDLVGLCAVVNGGPETGIVITHLRDLTLEESALARTDQLLLKWLSVGNPIRPLVAALDDFHASVAEWEQRCSERTWPEAKYEIDLQRRFRAWLTEFRIFDEHTAEEIRKQLGRSHKAVEHFKTVCSDEFDGNFGYKVASGLRNVALHSGGVLDLRMGQAEQSASEKVRARLALGSVALSQNTRLRPKTAAELKVLTFDLDPEKVAGVATHSCVRAWGRHLRYIEAEARAAVERADGLAAEVSSYAPDGALCVLIPNRTLMSPGPGRHQLNMTILQPELALEVSTNLGLLDETDLDTLYAYDPADLAVDP